MVALKELEELKEELKKLSKSLRKETKPDARAKIYQRVSAIVGLIKRGAIGG
jgi:hypothetical protein